MGYFQLFGCMGVAETVVKSEGRNERVRSIGVLRLNHMPPPNYLKLTKGQKGCAFGKTDVQSNWRAFSLQLDLAFKNFACNLGYCIQIAKCFACFLCGFCSEYREIRSPKWVLAWVWSPSRFIDFGSLGNASKMRTRPFRI